MLKAAFISPPFGLKERYGKLVPLSLAAMARKNGFEASVIPADSLNLDSKEIISRIDRVRPDCLAITSANAIYRK